MKRLSPKILILCLSVVVYMVLFIVFNFTIGYAAAIAGIVPAVAAGWLFGMRAGIAAGVLVLPFSSLLCLLLNVPDWIAKMLFQAAPGHISIIAIGGIIGRIRDLNLSLQHHYAKLHSAEKERRISEKRFRATAESSPDAIVNADTQNRIIYWNKGAADMFGYQSSEISGQSALILLPERYRRENSKLFEQFIEQLSEDFTGRTFEAMGLRKNGEEFPLEQSLSTWQVYDQRFFTSIIRDITDRKKFEQEREKLIHELQVALAEVKTLSGLLPICASCKKIRNDKGYWTQIEGYIREHTNADFSHSLCPDCAKKLYPEEFQDD